MSEAVEFRIEGLDVLIKRLSQLEAELRGPILGAALTAGALHIVNEAKDRVPKITRNLERSIHAGEPERMGDGWGVRIGTNVVYARRIEYGFVGRDRRGRVYNQAAKPYLRPAFDAKKEAAINAVRASLHGAIARAMKG